MKPPGPAAHGALLVVAATAGFASLGTLAGLAERAGMGSSAFVTLRAGLGAALPAGLLSMRPALWVPLRLVPPRQRMALLGAVAANGAFNLALFGAFALAGVPVTLAIYFTYPALVAVASVALGRERFTAVRLAGLALAIAGVVLLLGGRLLDCGSAEPLGLVLAVTAATLQATYLVISRSGFPTVAAEQAITLVLAGGAAMAAIATVAPGRLAPWPAGRPSRPLGWRSFPPPSSAPRPPRRGSCAGCASWAPPERPSSCSVSRWVAPCWRQRCSGSP